jgi:hypothetical protein
MKLLPWDAQLLLLGKARIGVIPQIAAQLKFFDVYYTSAPVVGFHVIGADSAALDIAPPVVGFHVVNADEPDPANGEEPVLGFHVIGTP